MLEWRQLIKKGLKWVLFCHGALKHDISTLFATFFVWTSLQFILLVIIIIRFIQLFDYCKIERKVNCFDQHNCKTFYTSLLRAGLFT